MGNYGIKIAKAGGSTNDPDKDQVFTSKYNTLKIYMKGTKSITTNGSGVGSGTVAHNLGYAPTFHVFRKGTASWQRLNAGSIDSGTYTNAYFSNPGTPSNWIAYHQDTIVSSDDTNLNISITGGASTTYEFRYFIFADLAEEYDTNSPLGDNDFGIKIAQPGKDALEQKDFQLGFSTKFRPLNYNDVKSGTINLSLPALWGSAVSDPTPEMAQYAEITHGLGYPPFFLGFWKYSDGTTTTETNYASNSALLDLGLGGLIQCIDSWCDSTRIRFTFWRKAYFEADDTWTATTINIKYLIFNEDLSINT